MSSWLLGFVVLACSTATARWTAAPVVDLGYALYQGYYSSTYDQTIYKGYGPSQASRDYRHR